MVRVRPAFGNILAFEQGDRYSQPRIMQVSLRSIAKGNTHMNLMKELLHQITDESLSCNERARLRCQLARQLEQAGDYESARRAMAGLWQLVGERPILEGIDALQT